MPMDRTALLNAIIDDAGAEIPLAYRRPDQKPKREGALAGLEACRGLADRDIVALHARAAQRTRDLAMGNVADYWHARMFELQVEWVLNVLSAAYHASGQQPLVNPTARGMLKAADILGIEGQ